jgi:hypothetical protein
MENKIRKIITKDKNKKALSEMVSYILLVVIAMGLAVGVFAWLKGQLPSENEEKCSDDVALTIVSYTCDVTNNKITLNLKNTGLFNINGIYARGSYDANKITTEMLNSPTVFATTPANSPEGSDSSTPGRYIFNSETPLSLGVTKTIILNYGETKELKKIQIQPYVNGKKNLLLCDNVVDLNLVGCN